MPKRRRPQVAAMRRSAWQRKVADLKEGRRQRAVTIPSAKAYKRRTKHIDHGEP